MKTALLIVDVQPTFCEEGSLPVDGGNIVAKKIGDLIGGSHHYDMVVTTQDWHIDPGAHFDLHPDFTNTWPRHGVAGTPEAELHPSLTPVLDKIDVRVKKGQYAAAYSGFEGADENGTFLHDILSQAGIQRIETVGLAFDYCVKETALDGMKLGYEVEVLKAFTAPVSLETAENAMVELKLAGVQINQDFSKEDS
ncbi:MAG: nicotinamidase [Acidimicrobiaceae bacterium]|nr:nicotinamidase [Acidimicrobiaceae bacterium]